MGDINSLMHFPYFVQGLTKQVLVEISNLWMCGNNLTILSKFLSSS